MTLVKVNNPINRFDGLMKDFFNEFPSTISKSLREDVLQFPPVNITEKTNAYEVALSAPGLAKEDFTISLENNLLTISAEQKTENTDSTDKMIRKEFSFKSFKRSFTIDEKIDEEQIGAKYENGILFMELPKKEIAKPAAKSISVQ